MNETYRQAIHFLGGGFFAGILLAFGKNFLLSVAFGLLAVVTVLGFLLKKRHRFEEVEKILHVVKRRTENAHPFLGGVFYLLGIIALFLFFEQPAILAGIIVLAVGDSASTIFGKKFGKTKITAKGHSLEGTLAGIIASSVVLYLAFPLPASIAVAISGMVSELLLLEDNFTIPITSALALTLILL